VAGIVKNAGGAEIPPLATMQKLTGNQGKASAFYLKLTMTRNADAVVTEIRRYRHETYVTHSCRNISMMTPDNIPACHLIKIVIGISVTIALYRQFQAMYTRLWNAHVKLGF